MNRDDLANYLALDLCTGIGPASFRKIIESIPGNPGSVFQLSPGDLSALRLKQPQIQGLNNPPWQ